MSAANAATVTIEVIMIAEVKVGYPLQPKEKRRGSTDYLWRPCRLLKDKR